MTAISNELKVSFGRLIVLLLMQQTADNTINPFITFSQTLLWFTNAGLIVEKKSDKYTKEMETAKKIHLEAVERTKTRGQPFWVQAEVKRLVFEVAYIVIPIALAEGILELTQESFNILEQVQRGNVGGDRPE